MNISTAQHLDKVRQVSETYRTVVFGNDTVVSDCVERFDGIQGN